MNIVVLADGFLNQDSGPLEEGTPLEFLAITEMNDVDDYTVKCRWNFTKDNGMKFVRDFHISEIEIQNEQRISYLMLKLFKRI